MRIEWNDTVWYIPPPPAGHAGTWSAIPERCSVTKVWRADRDTKPENDLPLVNLSNGKTSIPHRSKVPGADCNFYVC